jgi:Ala-tRNA(Pro) deacylase
MLSAEDEFLLAVVPASRHVDPDAVAHVLHARSPQLAQELDLTWVFRDCERGAVPVLGAAYGLPTVVDDDLLRSSHVYFEGGDHEHLVHLRGADFARILIGQPHGRISC